MEEFPEPVMRTRMKNKKGDEKAEILSAFFVEKICINIIKNFRLFSHKKPAENFPPVLLFYSSSSSAYPVPETLPRESQGETVISFVIISPGTEASTS